MRSAAAVAGLALLVAGAVHAQETKPLNTIWDMQNALRKCWVWPSLANSSDNMDLTIMLSFRADGELFGGRITHMNREVSDNERSLYVIALETMIRRCSHLPLSHSLGEAIAGRPFIFRIVDTRREKRA